MSVTYECVVHVQVGQLSEDQFRSVHVLLTNLTQTNAEMAARQNEQ